MQATLNANSKGDVQPRIRSEGLRGVVIRVVLNLPSATSCFIPSQRLEDLQECDENLQADQCCISSLSPSTWSCTIRLTYDELATCNYSRLDAVLPSVQGILHPQYPRKRINHRDVRSAQRYETNQTAVEFDDKKLTITSLPLEPRSASPASPAQDEDAASERSISRTSGNNGIGDILLSSRNIVSKQWNRTDEPAPNSIEDLELAETGFLHHARTAARESQMQGERRTASQSNNSVIRRRGTTIESDKVLSTLCAPGEQSGYENVIKFLRQKGKGTCQHAGSCSKNCRCSNNKTACRVGCKCAADCERRFPPCECQGVCGEGCICIRYVRDCRDACRCSACKNKPNAPTAQVVKRPSTIVGSGNGLFALAAIQTSDLIGEYEGEICRSSWKRKSDKVIDFLISAGTNSKSPIG